MDIQTGKNLPTTLYSYRPHEAKAPSASPAAHMPQAKKKIRFSFKKTILAIILSLFIFLIILGAWDARNISSASQKLFGSGNIFSLLSSSRLRGSSDGRVNVLLVGYSVDDPGHPGAKLTDSLILLSMSTTAHTGYMLSIPRDLYVRIPGNGYAKINEAYQDGGIDLLEQIISQDFGTPIAYYVLINYAAVRDTVNALGGIAVNIKSSDPRGLYDTNINRHDGGPLKLSNGLQTLNGQTALNLTRARGDGYGSYGFAQADFDRTQNQRLILTAIKNRLNWRLVLNPRKNSQILNAIADNIKTDVKAKEARSLFSLFNSIPGSALKSVSIRDLKGKNYLISYVTPYGQSALIPSLGLNDYSAIDNALQELR